MGVMGKVGDISTYCIFHFSMGGGEDVLGRGGGVGRGS